jgi:hypothetical protein
MLFAGGLAPNPTDSRSGALAHLSFVARPPTIERFAKELLQNLEDASSKEL